VRLGDKDDTYWNYLLEQATLAVDSDVPDSIFSDSQGKLMMKESTRNFKHGSYHNVSRRQLVSMRRTIAGKVWIWHRPETRVEFRFCGEPPVPQCPMASTAAKGLAQIQDKESIPLIIAASQRAAEDAAARLPSL